MKLRYLLLLSGLSIALAGITEGFAFLTLLMMVWLAGAFALRLRPSIRTIASERRLPRGGEIGAVLIGMGETITAFTALTLAVAGLAYLVDLRSLPLRDAMGWGVVALWAASSGAPLWMWLARRSRVGEGEVALWPMAMALAGGVPFGLGLTLLATTVIRPLIERSPYHDAAMNLMFALPTAALLVAHGGGWIVQAVGGRSGVKAVFQAGLTAALAGWIAVAVYLVLDLLGAFQGGALSLVRIRGGTIAAVYGFVIAVAWIRALSVIRDFDVDSGLSTSVIVVLLLLGFPLSLWVPAIVPQSDWTDFVAVVVFPFLIGTVAIVALLAPWIMRRLVWERNRLPWARRSPAPGPVSGI